MSLTYGFYNSENGDRRYNASQLSSMFDGVITDGVFEAIGDKFMVTAGTGMTVNVGTGRAWFNRTWIENDSLYQVTLENVSALFSKRIDTIVIDVNKQTRMNSIIVVKGTVGSSTAPDLIFDDASGHYQYPLCDVQVQYGVSAITQANITNRVGIDYPFVTGAVESVKVDALVAQWKSQFDEWMDTLRGLLDEETASKLAAEILELQQADLGKLSTDGSNSMTGPLFMGNNPIMHLQDPTDSTDAANKRYVDGLAGKVEMIWKNASQSSAMAAQYISIGKSIKFEEVYNALYIRCRYNTSHGYEQGILLMSTMGGICSFPRTFLWGITSADSEYSRCFLWHEDSVQISDGYAVGKNSTEGSYSDANAYCYPIAIYGIKF